MNIEVRKAVPEDSAVLAKLMNIAGDGIPAVFWADMAEPGENVMAVGTRRVARTEGGFSYTNVHVIALSDAIAGMLLGYRLPDTPEVGQLEGYPPIIRPLAELEALVPGAWYVNAVAVVSRYRGQGIGTRLMQYAETLAGESKAESIALIVAENNVQARTLYEKLGYAVIAWRPIVPYPDCPYTGDYVLMKKVVRI